MRRRVLVLVPFVALLVAACGSSGATSSTAGGALPAVTGDAGKKPTIAVPGGKPVTKLQVQVVTPGTGATLAAGNPVIVNYLGMTWKGKVFDNSFDRNQSFPFTLGQGQVIKGWDDGLVGQKVGSRLLLAIPPDLAYGSQGAGGDIGPNETLLFVVDVLAGFSNGMKASGTVVPLTDASLPKVTGDGADLAVTMPGGAAPTALVAKTLIDGSGPAVQKGQTIGVQYLGALWDGGTTFDSSWSRQGGTPVTFPIGIGKVIKGWDEALVGVKVGSRVLLVIPSDKAYGDAGRPPTIPAKAALVFVVDVLGAA